VEALKVTALAAPVGSLNSRETSAPTERSSGLPPYAARLTQPWWRKLSNRLNNWAPRRQAVAKRSPAVRLQGRFVLLDQMQCEPAALRRKGK
jgi:hypothetical protein